MQIIINGTAQQINDGTTITALLQQLKIDVQQIAVEQNGHIISRSAYDAAHIKAGDAIELVEFVGGG